MKVLRRKQVCEMVSYSPMHLWRLTRQNKFPQPIKLGPNSVGYLESEILAWIEARVAERDAKLQKQRATADEQPYRGSETSSAETAGAEQGEVR